MIISHYGSLQLVVITCTVIAVAVCAEYGNNTKEDNPTSTSAREAEEIRVQSSLFQVKGTNRKSNVTGLFKAKRAARYDTAASSPWVRVYNRPPGTKTESFYETRGNTSAHTSGEVWSSHRDDFSTEEKSAPIQRNDAKVRDILRVRTKPKDASSSSVLKNKETTTESLPVTRQAAPSTQTPPEEKETAEKDDKQNKGYLIWTNEGKSDKRWSLDGTPSVEDKTSAPSIEKVIPKDGSHWKVVGEGGEEGWQVVDDKGEVEWKIEYDDGEWRVSSTSNVPEDAEWANPEYVWGPSDGPPTYYDDYNSWPADDYRGPQDFAYPETFSKSNDSWSQKDVGHEGNTERAQQPQSIGNGENLQFGARRKVPSKNPSSSSAQERTDSESYETVVEGKNTQSDQGYIGVKSWVPGQVPVGGKQKWVQGYGSKSWTTDNSGLNAETGGETWVETSKNYNPWVPKVPEKQDADQQPSSMDIRAKQDNAIRAWGTGYGSKTWNGNEWDSSIVWNTGVNGNIPWDSNNSTWDFPDQSTDKKPQVWSQPVPSNEDSFVVSKKARPPPRNLGRIQLKRPGKPPKSAGRLQKPPPSRRTEGESWGDDDTFTGVIWKQDNVDVSPSTTAAPVPSTSADSVSWQVGGWKVSTPPTDGKPPAVAWKSNAPKVSNLVSVSWNAGKNPLDYPPNVWSQGQWVDTNAGPTWIFDGCKMTLKCGTKSDEADDTNQNVTPDTSDDSSIPITWPQPVTNGKVWPPKGKGIKSWRPPPKDWKPPKPMQPTPAQTTPETTNPPMTWKPPAPAGNWKKPVPPPMWNQPPTDVWTETTPTLPNISWKPPPPPMRWKKGSKPSKSWKPPPTKSWKPPPTKSWKPPPMPPMKTWQPPIATPQPDPVTKPDCKDGIQPTGPMQPNVEDNSDDTIEPPQIIIINKLPKGAYPRPDDNSGDPKNKLPIGPWIFPSRKSGPNRSNNRKDNINVGNSIKSRPIRPGKVPSRSTNKPNYWSKGKIPTWSNSMRRSTTKRSQTSPWKYPPYKKSNSWRQMFKQWLDGQ